MSRAIKVTDRVDPNSTPDDWGSTLDAAHEVRGVDAEWMETALGEDPLQPAPAEVEQAAKLRYLKAMMRTLDLNPETVRMMKPLTMEKLEAECLCCQARDQCRRALSSGEAAVSYHGFCPGASWLDALRDLPHPRRS